MIIFWRCRQCSKLYEHQIISCEWCSGILEKCFLNGNVLKVDDP